jgi:hypothetical protein
MKFEPTYRGFVIIDIEGFGRGRTDPVRLQMIEALERMLQKALRRAAIDDRDRMLKRLGDGLLVVSAPHVSTARLIHPVIGQLLVGLEAYNRTAAGNARMRVRVAVHSGAVLHRSGDFVGEELNHAFRLIESDTVRQRLADIEAPLVLVVSQTIYRGVVKHNYPGIDSAQYRAICITVKETRQAEAWIWTPPSAPVNSQPPPPPHRHPSRCR